VNVAELMVRALEAEGVKYVFGVPGEENEALLFALEESSITFVPTRHEQGAAFIANVFGRLTGKAGVCLATLGPGATNLLTGVADANLDRAPLVALTAQGGLDRLHHESHQALDVVAMLAPVTKWNTSITDPRVIAEVVRKAFKVAENEKPGAVHLELPEDVASEAVPEDIVPLQPRRVRRSSADYKAIAAAIDAIRKARRPLFVAGNGAIRKRASKHLTKLATTHGLPVVSTFMGKGAISDRLPQSLRSTGLGFRDHVNDAIDGADLLVCVGFDIAELPPERLNPSGKKPIVHIDFAPAEVYASYSPEVEVVCDISDALWQIDRALEAEPADHDSEWWLPIRARFDDDVRRDRLPPSSEWREGQRMTVPGALHVIRHVLPDDGLILSDVGSHKMWIARNFPVYEAGTCIISNGLASMGIALPGAIAGALADPGRPIVACMGDGGALMNVQELETAKRLGLAFVAVVLNDDDYGLISWKQRRHRGRSVSTRIGNPDFVKLGESFGLRAHRCETPESLEEALRGAFDDGALTLIEIPVDPSVNDALVKRLSHLDKDDA